MKRLLFLAIASLFALAATTRAADQWTLTTADFSVQPVQLSSVDADGVHVVSPGKNDPHVVGYDDFLDIQRIGASQGSPAGLVVRLANGDTLGGNPVSLKGDDLIWNSTGFGQVTLSMQQVRSIRLPNIPLATDRPTQDVVSLANGDSVRGTVINLDAKTVTVTTDTNTVPVPLASVKSIALAATGNAPPAKRGFRVHLEDGAAVIASDIALTNGALKLTFGKNESHTVELSHVVAIEQVNGPVSWLSQRPPTVNIYTPLVGSTQKYVAQMDRTVTGDPLHFGSRSFAHGIGVHSYSRLAWPLDGSYAAFRTQYAIDGDRPVADVTVRIKLDDRVIYEQPHVRSGVLSAVIVKELGNAKLLTLEVDYGDNLDAQDHLNWLGAALLKTVPPPPPPPAPPTPTPSALIPATATQPDTSVPLVVPETQPSPPATQPSAVAPAPTTQGYYILGKRVD